MTGVSVLWPRGIEAAGAVGVESAGREDLNIGAVIGAVVKADAYGLRGWFERPVRDPEVVRYRQEVFADVMDAGVRGVFETFAGDLRVVRKRLEWIGRQQHPCQRERWLVGAAAEYVEAVRRLADELGALTLESRGLRGWREFVSAYVSGGEFGRLAEEVGRVQRRLDGVRYGLRIVGRSLEVGPAGDEADYSAGISELFSRFGTGAPRAAREPSEWDEMAQMEEQVLDRVAALNPDAFAELSEFAEEYKEFADAEVLRFDREIQFYLMYLAFARRVCGDTRAMCLPELASGRDEVRAEGMFDLALLTRRGRGADTVVCNDFRLSGPERVLVVTGPNQGGKTTFARAFGQLMYFAALGCPVPARSACLPLADRVFTHFERAEQATDPDGRLADELVRIRDVLEQATADSVIVLNESFSSTSTADAVRISGDVLERIAERGSIAVWVTFFDELARGGPATVSMVAATDPADPGRRTFSIERRAADGNAHAVVLAERFGLTYDLVTARITSCR
ncbi:DNA mismatch repair protein MutS [Nocardia sp. NPDC020380]|uniref:MutS-related protein n=1 Tax=Nocardia sp. NPDC020380 TaxID=3364309 RepID=UPI0037B8650D